jgi:hypothetical protein
MLRCVNTRKLFAGSAHSMRARAQGANSPADPGAGVPSSKAVARKIAPPIAQIGSSRRFF